MFSEVTGKLSKFYRVFECIHHPFWRRENNWQYFIQVIQEPFTKFFETKLQQEISDKQQRNITKIRIKKTPPER